MYSPIRDKFPSIFENVVLGIMKPFFQSNHQVDVSLYLTHANVLCHSRELASLKASYSTFSPVGLLASRTLKSITIHSFSPSLA
jgi:hypothetical protein